MSALALRTAAWAGRWWLAATDPLPPVDQNPDDVQDAACRIVERSPEICRPPTTQTVPRDTTSRSSGGALDLLGVLLWMVLIAGLVLLVYVIVRNLGGLNWWRGRRRRSGDGDDEAEDDDEIEQEGVAVDRSREPVNWRAEAEAHRAAGRFRDALRCRYRALVGDLARRGLIDEIPGRTTGEERAQLRVVLPDSSPPFEEAADLFDEAWYGLVPVGAGDDDRFQHLEQDVLERARGKA